MRSSGEIDEDFLGLEREYPRDQLVLITK